MFCVGCAHYSKLCKGTEFSDNMQILRVEISFTCHNVTAPQYNTKQCFRTSWPRWCTLYSAPCTNTLIYYIYYNIYNILYLGS